MTGIVITWNFYSLALVRICTKMALFGLRRKELLKENPKTFDEYDRLHNESCTWRLIRSFLAFVNLPHSFFNSGKYSCLLLWISDLPYLQLQYQRHRLHLNRNKREDDLEIPPYVTDKMAEYNELLENEDMLALKVMLKFCYPNFRFEPNFCDKLC
jgi:hypothetical protein